MPILFDKLEQHLNSLTKEEIQNVINQALKNKPKIGPTLDELNSYNIIQIKNNTSNKNPSYYSDFFI